MVDALLWHRSGQVIIVPSTGTAATGGVARFYDSGTDDARTVYTSSGLTGGVTTTTFDSNGVADDIWLPTGAYKYTLETSDGVVFATHDAQLGATDTSGFLTGTVAPSRAVISKSAAYTTDASTDKGKQINANASGGDFTITLDTAVDYADGGDQLIKNIGESGVVTVSAAGGQTIDGETSVLVPPESSIVVRSDGGNFYATEAYNATDSIVVLTDEATITPDLIYPRGTNYQVTLGGDRTIANATSVRPGTFGTFTLIQDATGSRTPTWGSNYKGSAAINRAANAVNVIGFHARSATEIDIWPIKGLASQQAAALSCIIRRTETRGTDGGSATAGAWTKSTLDSTAYYDDSQSLSSLSSSVFTLLPGTYYIRARQSFVNVGAVRLGIYNSSESSYAGLGDSVSVVQSNSGSSVPVSTNIFTITSNNNFELHYWAETATATIGLGRPVSSGTDDVEIYSFIEIWRYG